VRTNRVYIQIRGDIPGAVLQALRDEYGRSVILRCEGLEPWTNILDAPLYARKPLTMYPGAYLRFFRRDNGLSQSELGSKLGGVSRQNISNMEYGRRPISRRMALRLAGVFEVSADKFIGGPP
jgi:DNA-binding XRE family transcriptional regulator